MRIDETAKRAATRLMVYAGIIIASPLLLVAGAPIRTRYLQYIYRDDAPPVVDKPNGVVSVHYYVVMNPLLYRLCWPTQTVIYLARRFR
ncbi:hypothetical protein PUR61_09520 [Streptomyces sp. BE20]|uniref:hypothetical protein n=1 Tax=Streptomyces sp. BE20 TaxID=3002525 RepID=UPI002E7A4881|nr:hypothetical protein [Streptomyces sp. BE20]MEE1822429.1 hypothetical protein [Streptomyces sp. BE20]